MKNYLFIFILLVSFTTVVAQGNDKINRGTINVQKPGRIAKIQFDEVNYRLFGIDEYGNMLDSAVVEFKIAVTIKGIFYEEVTKGPYLSFKMQHLIGKHDQITKLFFDKIKAKDRNGTMVDIPKFQYTFGPAQENNEGE